MRKLFKYLFFILLAAGIGGYIYWQNNKKKIIKDSITDAIKKETDSLYYIHYDSSTVDEINGNAAFYNVTLQSDSAQKELLKRTDSLPNALFNIKVTEVKAFGIDVAGLLSQQNVAAKKILLNKPSVHIINTGNDKPKLYTSADTMELYRKILGRFKSIKADVIEIKNGSLLITNIAGKSLATLENINVVLNNFLVDSTHDYANIVSYFIKDVKATVENIQVLQVQNNTSVNIEGLDYDAINKTLKAGAIKQYKINNSKPIIDLKNISLTGLSTDSFILYHKFKAGSINCAGGLITIYKKNKKENNKPGSVELSSDIIDEIQVGSAKLGKTKIIVVNSLDPLSEPFVMDDVEFNVVKVLKVDEGSTLNDLINNAQWKLNASGFSFFTKDKLYKMLVADIAIDNITMIASIKKFSLIPLLSEEAFMKQRTIQGDRYDFTFNNIKLEGINLNAWLNENKIEMQTAELQALLKIYNDRTLPYDTRSKVGLYPHQLLSKLDIPVFINKLQIKDGNITYKERGRLSQFTGQVVFSNLNATINNLTNIEDKLKLNPYCNVTANTIFLGEGKLHTDWKLPLRKNDTAFTIAGELQQMHAKTLNRITEPLGMTSIKKGMINNLKFNFTGGNYSTNGSLVFLYKDLNIQVLKKNKDDELVKKDLISFLANFMIKNSNPQNGITRNGQIDNKRDITKSFFYLLWTSVLNGVKKTAAK